MPKKPVRLPVILSPEEEGYLAAVRVGLSERINVARRVLWSVGAAGREDHAPPEDRRLWLAAHSGGNLKLAEVLNYNWLQVSRVICNEPSGDGTLPEVLRVIALAVAKRKSSGKTPLEAIFVITPHMSRDPAGLTAALKKQIDAAGAGTRYLPDPKEAADFWRIPPKARTPAKAAGKLGTQTATDMIEDASSPYMRYFFENFPESELFDVKGNPRVSFRDFHDWLVHEMAVFAGHLDPITQAAKPDPPRTTRTLLEQSFALLC